jgi:hypothetical protein
MLVEEKNKTRNRASERRYVGLPTIILRNYQQFVADQKYPYPNRASVALVRKVLPFKGKDLGWGATNNR